MSLLLIDGARGEGGGQILRSSLALAVITGRPVRLQRIRAGRPKPGLARQHLTCALAAAEICGGQLRGAELRSQRVDFTPGPVRAGEYTFTIGTAGSTGLVLQTVLPPLLLADGPSRVVIEGGTHNPGGPPFDFLARAFVPALRAIGARVEVTIERHGFVPAGGGRIVATIEPAPLRRLERVDAAPVVRRPARALVARLDPTIGGRELGVVRERLGWEGGETEVVQAGGPGNALVLEGERADGATEVVTGFGEKGVRAELVADRACAEARAVLDADVPVGEHLADQLMLPLAIGAGGRYRTLPLSLHSTTNIDTIGLFLDVPIAVEPADGGVIVTVG